MIEINSPQKLSTRVLGYYLIKAILGSMVFSAIIYIGIMTGSNTGQLKPYAAFIPLVILALNLGYAILYWKIFTFTLFPDHMTIKSGVVFQNEKTVNFNDVQSSNAALGPLLAMFGLRIVKAFTSSPEQLIITSGKNGSSTRHVPDLQIIIEKESADQIIGIIKKGDVQKVQNVV